MGLGLLGRGVGDTCYLAECGAELIITDLKSREELAESVAQLQGFKNIQFVLGEHRLGDFKDRDFILKAAGVPLDSIYIAEAKKNNIPVRMSADLFAEISCIPVIGVTGTRGKSTVTHMVYEILKLAGDASSHPKGCQKVVLGGNVRGVSNLELLKIVTSEHIAVLELDSWQLQGWGEAKMSPHISVFTTFYPDHLNYYHNDLDVYLADKANIFLYQKPEDILVLGEQVASLATEKYGGIVRSRIIVAGEADLPVDWRLKIPGAHNRYDAALALAVARTCGIADDVSRRALESFAGVPGRLELIREVNGVKIYNDTTSTTPEATLAAISAITNMSGRSTSRHNESQFRQPIILIMGGTDKGLDMNTLLMRLANVKQVILLAGTGTSRVLEFIPNASVFDDLSKAVQEAFAVAESGDTILFSPAFTSFGMFKNEYDRGDQFDALVKKL